MVSSSPAFSRGCAATTSSSPRPKAIGERTSSPDSGRSSSRFRVSMFSGVPTFYAALLRDADRRQRPLQPRIRDLRGSADAGGPHPRFRSEDGGEDPRRIRPDGRRLRFRRSIRPAANGSRVRSVCPSPISGWPPSCWTAKGAFSEWPISTRSASSRSTGPTSFQVISTLVTTKASGSTSTANAGSTPAISAGGMPTAISGSPGARRSSSSEADTTSIPRSSRTRCRRTRRSP